MSYSDTIKLVQGDNLPGIQFRIRNKKVGFEGQYLDEKDSNTWAYVDLSEASASASIREIGSDVIIDRVPLMLLDALTGSVILPLALTTFQSIEGSYELEATVSFTTLGQQTVYDFLRLNVRERF